MKYFISAFILASLLLPVPLLGQSIITSKIGINSARTHYRFGNPVNSLRLGISVASLKQNYYGYQLGADYVLKGDLGHRIFYIELSGLGVIPIISSDNRSSLSLLAGPAIGVKFKEDDFSYHSNLLDFSFSGGLGLQLPIIKKVLFKVELLYTVSIIPVNNVSMRNYVFSVSTGIGFSH